LLTEGALNAALPAQARVREAGAARRHRRSILAPSAPRAVVAGRDWAGRRWCDHGAGAGLRRQPTLQLAVKMPA
jgi:hypothetical protein